MTVYQTNGRSAVWVWEIFKQFKIVWRHSIIRSTRCGSFWELPLPAIQTYFAGNCGRIALVSLSVYS